MHKFLAISLLFVGTPSLAEPLPEAARVAVIKSLKDQMLDGETARWRWPDQIPGDWYCGFVNAKNRFGAYVGFRPYMTMLMQGSKGWVSAPVVVGGDDRSSKVASSMCREKGYSMLSIPPDD